MSDHTKVYGICENLCQVPVSPKSEVDEIITNVNNNTDKLNSLTMNDITSTITATGTVSVTLNPDTEYTFTKVTSLTLSPSDTLKALTNTGQGAHGFVGFASSTPTITVSGFDYSDGDNIASATASGIWEFDVKAFNGGTYILWKKWK